MMKAIPSQRLVSLDAFRGATLAAMLLVNNPGSWSDLYPMLEHAPWHGWTPTDMIFPFFLWIMGLAMPIAFARRLEQGAGTGELTRHLFVRSGIIFGLGLLLAAFPFGLMPGHPLSLATLRIPGVLQRIALCYLAAGAILLRAGWRGQLAWVIGILVGYWALLKGVPVPGYGPGMLEPTGNLAWWIDSHLLAGHTWSGAPAPGFDPEGLLSTLPAVATTLCGALAGQWLRSAHSPLTKTGWLLAGGLVLLGLGAGLSSWLPINKNLWTSTFVLLMAGWAMVIFAGFYWLMDVRGSRRWATPLLMFGMNALLLYVVAGLVARLLGLIHWTNAAGGEVSLKGWLYEGWLVPLASPRDASLLFALGFVLVHLGLAWALWRKRWFVRI